MIYNTVYFELKNKYNYNFTATIFEIPILVIVSYNNLAQKRIISISSPNGELIYLKPTYITRGARINPTFSFTMNEVEVFISLFDFKNSESDDYLNWGNYYRLAFVNPVEDVVTPMKPPREDD